MKLTEHFTTEEAERSDIAAQYGIPNVMTPEDVERARALAVNVLEPLRKIIGRPINISSWFRCRVLNSHRKIRGAKDSQHPRAEAADITAEGITVEELFRTIRSFVPFDQVIQEHDEWVHVSWRENPRGQALRAHRVKNEATGKMETKYTEA